MKILILRSLVLLFSVATSTVLAAPPVNDSFEKATALTGRGVTLTNQKGSAATANALDPYLGKPLAAKPLRSIWYRFDAPLSISNVRVIIADNTATGSRAGVFRLIDPDGGAGSLVSVEQATVSGGLDTDTITFSITHKARYYIVIDAPGSVDITLKIPGHDNDFFENATVLAGNEDTIVGTNINASNDLDVPSTLPSPIPQAGVWYRWTPSFSGAAHIDTFFSEVSPGSPHDTILAVYSGTSLANLTLLDADDDTQASGSSKVSFTASAGTTYRIWVGTFEQKNRGNFTLSYYPATTSGEFVLRTLTSVTENQGNVVIEVRHLRPGVAASVTLKTGVPSSGQIATAGADYIPVNTTLNFSASQLELTTSFVTILRDDVVDPGERFSVTLSAPTAGATLGSPSTEDITISDQSGTVAPGFTTSTLRVREGDGVFTFRLARYSGIDGTVSMSLIAGSPTDTAVDSVDYSMGNTTFVMGAGVNVLELQGSIINDGTYRGQRSLTLRIASATPGINTPNNDILRIIIEDDDLVVPAPGRVAVLLDSGGIGGSVDMTVSATGSVSGKVIMARGTFAFTGKLNAAGYLVARLGPATGLVRSIQVQVLNTAAKTYQVTLNDGEQGTTVSNDVIATNFTALTPCPVAGKHTLVDEGAGGIVPLQVAGLLTVSPLGSASLTGKLFDGTALAAAGYVNGSHVASLGATLYAGKGRVFVNTNLSSTVETISTGSFYLLRPGRANQTTELPSLDSSTTCRVARYIPRPAGQRILTIWNAGTGNADLTEGGFAMLTTKAFTISTANKITVTTSLPEKLAISLNAATGQFTGSVLPTGATTPKPVYGFVMQGGANSYGRGFFLNGVKPGKVVLRGP